MNLRALLGAIRRYWLTFIGVTVPLLALGGVGLYFMPLKYVSTTELLVSIQGSTTAAAYQNDGVVAGRISSYIPLLTSDVVAQRVVDKLGLPLTAPELATKISAVNVPPNTALIDVAVTDESPDQARQIADAVASEFISYSGALETPTGEDGQKVSTTVVTAASEPKARIGELIVLGVAAALAALALGALSVWLRARRGYVGALPRGVAVRDEAASWPAPTTSAHGFHEDAGYGEPAWVVEHEAAEIEELAPGDVPAPQAHVKRGEPEYREPAWVAEHEAPEVKELAPWAVPASRAHTHEEPEMYRDPDPALVQAWTQEPEAYPEPGPVSVQVWTQSPGMAYDVPEAADSGVYDGGVEDDPVVDDHQLPRPRLRSRPSSTGGRELRLMSQPDVPTTSTESFDPTPATEVHDSRQMGVAVSHPEAGKSRRVNGSRHRRAEDVGTTEVPPAPPTRVNGSRHRAEDFASADEEVPKIEFVTGIGAENEIHPNLNEVDLPSQEDPPQLDGDTPEDRDYSPNRHDDNALKDWDGQRWVRRR